MIMKITGTVLLVLGLCAGFPDPGAARDSMSTARDRSETGPCCGQLSPSALHILQILNDTHVEELWQSGRHINWETGEPDRPLGYLGPETKTHCSAFAAAVGERLGVYMLRPPQHAQELLANAQTSWFDSEQGREAGWYRVDTPERAQAFANHGKLVVVSYASSDPHRPGHIGIVRPDARRTLKEIQNDGVFMTQAGETNYLRVSERTAFKHHTGAWPDGVRYFAHDIP